MMFTGGTLTLKALTKGGMKKEDIPLFLEAECHITIYDDYVE